MAEERKSLKVILGTMTFGVGGRVSDFGQVQSIVSLFREKGHRELDTARMYLEGRTEQCLGELGYSNDPYYYIATKVYPTKPGDHEPEKLKATFKLSLEALKTKKVNLFYLHAPDRATDIEATLGAVNDLYKEGAFDEFGLSNYKSWEVTRIYYICKQKGYVLPTVYQGMYNALTRDVERELISCLRELKIRFYAYNPLCGGMLAKGYNFDNIPDSGRFGTNNSSQGSRYRQRYWKKQYFDVIANLRVVCEKHNLTTTEVAFRWLNYHSQLSPKFDDGIIIGVSSVEQTKENLEYLERGPLPEEVIAALDDAWVQTKAVCETYYR